MNYEPYALLFLAGFLGQFMRGSIGIYKATMADKPILWEKFIITSLFGGVVGGIMAAIFVQDFKAGIAIGWAGVDAAESIFRAKK